MFLVLESEIGRIIWLLRRLLTETILHYFTVFNDSTLSFEYTTLKPIKGFWLYP